MSPRVPPVLVLAVGNPSRGDDALGPLLLARLERALAAELEAGHLELLTDFQLQPEHALDLVGRERVVFVDASVKAPAPYAFEAVHAVQDATFSTHAMSPAAVLHALGAMGEPAPRCEVLAIRGERFELGEGLSAAAQAHLDAAEADLLRRLATGA